MVRSLSMQLAFDAVFGVCFSWVRPRFSQAGNKGMKPLPVSLLKMNPRKYGKGGEFASNRLDDQEIAMLALHLLQISMVYINTLMVQDVLKDDKWLKRLTVEDYRGLTPLFYGHVEPYGTLTLDMTRRLALA